MLVLLVIAETVDVWGYFEYGADVLFIISCEFYDLLGRRVSSTLRILISWLYFGGRPLFFSIVESATTQT
jgi:hypothetical protein